MKYFEICTSLYKHERSWVNWRHEGWNEEKLFREVFSYETP